MKYYAGMMAAVVLVALATVGGYRAWDKATHTRDDNGGVLTGGDTSSDGQGTTVIPSSGQVIITGSVTKARIEGAQIGPLATPFTVAPLSRGVGGATFTPVDVDGHTTSIDWQTGQPLPIQGKGGSVTFDSAVCSVDSGAINLEVSGVFPVAPGSYSLKSSVAVGSEPRDSVTFTANDKTTVEFRGGAAIAFPMPSLDVHGTGNVTLEGTLRVTHPDGEKSTMSSISLAGGAYEVKLDPTGNGDYTVNATLQGVTR